MSTEKNSNLPCPVLAEHQEDGCVTLTDTSFEEHEVMRNCDLIVEYFGPRTSFSFDLGRMTKCAFGISDEMRPDDRLRSRVRAINAEE